MFSLTFVDGGKPYNPLENDDPDVSLPAEERQIGGLGIFLVKKTMDDVRYERKGDQNYFTIFKKIR
jgi:sigma-B regulation protein RsbU (phosphoserine phosphatase)